MIRRSVILFVGLFALFVVLGLVLGAANISLLLVQSFAYALIALGLNIQWGYGGLFNAGGKRADAMYALLLENEALEEALFTQNDKLRQERTDAVKEQLRAASYRRVLMSQLLEEGKMKGTADRVLGDEHGHESATPQRQLADHTADSNHQGERSE